MGQAAQLHRVIRPARENGEFTLVAIATGLVRKAIVPDFEAERPGCTAPRSRAEREIGFGQAMPAARRRPRAFEKGGQDLAVGRAEKRKGFDSAQPPFRLLDEDMGRGNAIVERAFHLRNSLSGGSRRTIPDPQRVRAGDPFPAGSRWNSGARMEHAAARGPEIDHVPPPGPRGRGSRTDRWPGPGSGPGEEHGRAGGLPRLQRTVGLRRLRERIDVVHGGAHRSPRTCDTSAASTGGHLPRAEALHGPRTRGRSHGRAHGSRRLPRRR